MSPRRRLLLASGLAFGGLAALAGCAPELVPVASTTPATTTTTPPGGSADPTSAPTTGLSPAPTTEAAALSLEAQVGQLIMVGHNRPVLDSATRALLSEHQIGALLLLGNNLGGRTEVAALASVLGALDLEVPIIVAVDQEGGQVQRLSGAGFSPIPDAVTQSQMTPAELQAKWTVWGGELARAGIRYNLAPVADVVPADNVARNAPIGQLRRYYGTTTEQSVPSVVAAVTGLARAGVATSLKHFPGLGRVAVNTDFGVAVDDGTTGTDAELAAFAAPIKAGASSVMVSSAVYRKIDPDQQGVFSTRIITEILRQRLGFTGVVIADDLGAAAAVKDVPAGERAIRFLRAGGDLVINADPSLTRSMVGGILDLARNDADFAAAVTEKAGRVLRLKASVS